MLFAQIGPKMVNSTIDTFIKDQFDAYGQLLGFMSIRQDITDIKGSNEIRRKTLI